MENSTPYYIEIYYSSEHIMQVLCDYNVTDEFVEMLEAKKRKVLCINYGFASFCDLVIYEV